MFQTTQEIFAPANPTTLYVRDEDLGAECSVCGGPARRFNTRLGDFFCSERCVRIARPSIGGEPIKTTAGDGHRSDGVPVPLGGVPWQI